MKQNMKRMLLVLCMAVCFFALSACGSASEEAVEPISPEIEQTISDGAKSYLEQFASYSDEDLAALLKQAEKQKNTVIESAISSWTSSKDELGKMGEFQSVTVERADDDSYTAVVQASFEKRDLTFSLTAEESVSSYGGTPLVPTELSFVVNYSFGEKMEKAALYTLMGMGTVFLVLIFILPMWLNFLLRTLAWQTLLEKTGVINSILSVLHLPSLNIINTPYAIVLGMVYNFLPFMVLPLYNVLVKIDKNVINAAYDLGANGAQTFFRIIFPLSLPGMFSGITMVFVPSLTTYVISKILGGSKILLIGNVIEQEFTQTGNWNLGSGLSIVLMLFIIFNMVISVITDKEGEANTL